jgi:hypothetical protein
LRGLSCLWVKLARAVLRGGDGGNAVSLLDYDGPDRKVKNIREGKFYPTHSASPQGTLLPLTPQDFMVVYRARAPRRRMPPLSPVQPQWRFEVVYTR